MQPATKNNPLRWFWNYLRESQEELKKVTWPSKEDVVKYSVLVIGISLVIGIFMAILDFGFTIGLEKLISLTS